ncbi:hydroxyethylthiazole kinase [Lachnotalea glycerini]|uniref:Hydroxyethylthiazole kinase n=1 Tax=Lachnotalea glycerini TaxID=1763509 RepID=A0A255IAT9_9FIRM|nr:hydroxyethylthiazole kinase [Lachnotalea glycerini]PXV96119.1 hydroxyethylthiazole kinase [Lachnotalea glycerini]RDY31305.1 hydroxyethylthiazole kinase [Lachnotalea glycerini]
MIERIIENVRSNTPLIHCITNYVTVNDVANVLLACGASPIMADDINEAAEITSICSGLDINIGTLNTRTIEAMIKAGKKANELGHITVLDPVGAGASKLRTDTAFELLKEIRFSVIRGNISEIKSLYQGSSTSNGVDANVSDRITEANLEETISFAKELSKKTKAVIAITGAIDIIADENKAYVIQNGHPIMSKITGTGCMLTGIIAAYCAANPSQILEATKAAVICEGLAGEKAYEKMQATNGYTSTFRMYLIDYIGEMTDQMIREGMKVEIR